MTSGCISVMDLNYQLEIQSKGVNLTSIIVNKSKNHNGQILHVPVLSGGLALVPRLITDKGNGQHFLKAVDALGNVTSNVSSKEDVSKDAIFGFLLLA